MATATGKALNKFWRMDDRTRQFVEDRGYAEQYVADVMSWGYYVHDFSPYHVRIQDAVDFWPTRIKWFHPKGYKFDNHGVGMASLRNYLSTYFPTKETPDGE